MTSPSMVKLNAWLRRQGNRSAKGINGRTSDWLRVLTSAIKETLKPDTAITAAAIAYFSLFSLFPITLLSISIASFSFGPHLSQHEVMQRLEFVAPALSELLGDNIDHIIRARGPVSSVALVSLIWSASSVFYTLTHTLNGIWHIKQNRAAWKRRGLAILFVLAFVGPALLLISMAGSVLTNLRFWLPDLILPLTGGIRFLLTLFLDIALFMAVYMLLPHGKSTWKEILPGAMSAGLLWEVAKNVFLAFVATYISISNLVYGTVAAIIAFLFWSYISSLIFLFGAHVSVSYWEYKQVTKN